MCNVDNIKPESGGMSVLTRTKTPDQHVLHKHLQKTYNYIQHNLYHKLGKNHGIRHGYMNEDIVSHD